ncbi:protein-methionine-sulfoxide reductase catalytic subunit MsrP [Marinomonas mediterranea]|jgi:Sulfite oxidase and related enzymes|uniref:Protein-methionine-sulfoxide reductase catalytic subunit MsrP n=1 Tax=Marinomonas mediterranea (strain ATCC 700492 / JCM 21426 / NBRC 103028 / MMB-1) TaxID=717774 RepID=F2K314_MARM1|nr:protein-methionine-sulfoxide reductase catalytic subunit MsrP [Marinomonas mediterranea]ADZ92403.1 Sulfoxide reductase catalytic subunit yedY [Marinomonas mediterranea MMB-1]WCN10355.1 protein-methionine-sulfoxide reductase catalytic subunit MsrP [Marinomonas mediterranea]WCN18453.1 protein-methionine-sulfoxide reductase catalytic subunit MsrP [Marinomonas mediterranea MMB-1]
MQIKIAKPSDCHESTVTPKSVYLNRRQFMQAGLASGAALSFPVNAIASVQNGNPLLPPESLKPSFASIIETPFGKTETSAPFETATTYNNFYEFGYGKGDPEKNAESLKPYPWKITIEGEADITGAFDLEDLIKDNQLEERIYRLRCVEAWSMVVPWVGIPLGALLKKFKPNSKAKYVYFETLYDPSQMPAQNGNSLDWPYREGLRIDEAMNSLSLLAVGMYGSILPNQNGAPVRLVVPWKYGFKSIKSIVTIRFVEQMPQTTWSMLAPNEYGFYANVNPGVDHPRWSQKQERRLPGGLLFPNVIDTQMFNGYKEEVASLYSNMNLTRFY